MYIIFLFLSVLDYRLVVEEWKWKRKQELKPEKVRIEE